MTGCRCSGFLDVSTPQSVKDEMDIDVFDEIWTLTGSASTYASAYKSALWHAYRYRKIGSCDLEYWEQCVADKMTLILPRYDAFMDKWADTDATDLSDGQLETNVKRTPIEGTDGDVSSTETETFPITPVDETERYLTGRNRSSYAPNTEDNTIVKSYGGLSATTFSQMMDDYNSPLQRFIDEFSDFFVNRWM